MAKEIVLVKPTWVGGVIKQPEAVVSLPDADASYLVSIGRAEFVVEAQVEVKETEQTSVSESLIDSAKKNVNQKSKRY